MNTAVRITLCGLFLLLILRPADSASSSGRYSLSNGFISASGIGGALDSLKVDPSGNGAYGVEMVKRIWAGDGTDDAINENVEWTSTESSITINNVRIYSNPQKIAASERDQPVRLEKDRTLGQVFTTVRPGLAEIAIATPTWQSERSGVTIKLKKDGPNGDVVAAQEFRDIRDNGWLRLKFSSRPKGRYYIEMSDPIGPVGWWTGSARVLEGCEPVADGQSAVCGDRVFEAVVYDVYPATITYKLDGSRISGSLVPDEPRRAWRWHIKTPWIRDGYDLKDASRILFSRFYTDQGYYLPVAQLKRKDALEWDLSAKSWVYATGTGMADLRFATNQSILIDTDADSMVLGLGSGLELAVLPHTDAVPEYYPEFFSSDPKFDRVLNEFLYDRAFTWPLSGINPDWYEWLALIHSWVDRPGTKDAFQNWLLNCKQDTDGYIYTWGDAKGWPFPDNQKYDTRHFTTNSNFILASYRFYTWTGDLKFLKANAARLRKAMDFQLNDLGGKEGIITLPVKDHGGTPQDVHSNYWDDLPFGGKSAYENIYFYASLGAMADIEKTLGNDKRSAELQELQDRARELYNSTFWNDKAGRYIGCIDKDGTIRDYGFTYVNTEAMAYGLADKEKAQKIYHWMEHEKTSSGKTDTYARFRFAPRVNTIDCKDWWYLEGKAEIPSQQFDTHLENGGAILFTSYYDIMARSMLLDANNAFKRLEQILERYQEPDRLCGGSPLLYGEINGWQVGTDVPFPESGLVPCSFLYAFLGIQATPDGLLIKPNLPRKLKFAGVRNLVYKGLPLEIKVTRDSVLIKSSQTGKEFTVEQPIKAGEGFTFKEPGEAGS